MCAAGKSPSSFCNRPCLFVQFLWLFLTLFYVSAILDSLCFPKLDLGKCCSFDLECSPLKTASQAYMQGSFSLDLDPNALKPLTPYCALHDLPWSSGPYYS